MPGEVIDRAIHEAALRDLSVKGGCPICLYNMGRSERTGLPLCARRRDFPDEGCFEWRGVAPCSKK